MSNEKKWGSKFEKNKLKFFGQNQKNKINAKDKKNKLKEWGLDWIQKSTLNKIWIWIKLKKNKL